MKDTLLKYGLHGDMPDLLKSLPALGRLKKLKPSYIKRAEAAQKIARRFARDEMLPRVLETDKKCTENPQWFDWELWQKANRAKLTISPIPEKLGGLGWSALGNAVMVEELASVCLAGASNVTFNTFGLLGALVECRTGIVLNIIRMMVGAQKKEKPMFWSWAITEPAAGSDMEEESGMKCMRPSTRAEKVPGGYRINGAKCFITNGSLADFVIASIPLDSSNPLESMATFLVPASAKGFSVGRVERKCGQKASQTAELFFDNLFVPEENLWEPPGRGLRHTREILSVTRGYIGIAALGMARGALEHCIQYAAKKKIKEHRLIDEEWVQMAIADMVKDIMTLRNCCYNFAVALDTWHAWQLFDRIPVKIALNLLPGNILLGKGIQAIADSEIVSKIGSWYKHRLVPDETVEQFVALGSAAKVAGTDLAVRISSKILDIVGLEGLSHEFGMEKYFRDAKVTQIYEGTNQVNRIDIFNHEIGALL
jgi:acyl-CoA dehydrogenase